MRLVLDTNTVVFGLIWGGVPGQLIDAAAAGTKLGFWPLAPAFSRWVIRSERYA